MKRVAIIGGGAAGCFCSVLARRRHPDWQVSVYEAGARPMAKLAVTGGGRCNLTNSFASVRKLADAYPRGAALMRNALRAFSQDDTMAWFEREGVRLTVQPDGCVFPESQDAMQIVRTLSRLMQDTGVILHCGKKACGITPAEGSGLLVRFSSGESIPADRVVLCCGGTSRAALEAMLPEGQPVTDTLPSLFTLRLDDAPLRSLMGTVVENTALRLEGTDIASEGTLLVTDWGVSGPATLRLSSYAAKELARMQYRGTLLIGWTGQDEAATRELVYSLAGSAGRKTLGGARPDGLSDRLWRHILARAGADSGRKWAETGRRQLSDICRVLTRDAYPICGRARFKEEFVTCGGVSLEGVAARSLESTVCPGLFFAGEALDIDAVTGGFNLQAAWSTAWRVAEHL